MSHVLSLHVLQKKYLYYVRSKPFGEQNEMNISCQIFNIMKRISNLLNAQKDDFFTINGRVIMDQHLTCI